MHLVASMFYEISSSPLFIMTSQWLRGLKASEREENILTFKNEICFFCHLETELGVLVFILIEDLITKASFLDLFS